MSRILTVALALALSVPVAAQQPQPASTDADFLMKAAEAGMKAMEAAILAADKAANADVKAYARRLVIDQSITNGDLLKLSKSKNVTLPVVLKTDPTKLLNADATTPAPAMTPEGASFDRAFLDQMVKASQEAIDLFKAEADDGKDSEVKEWAEKKILSLKDHLELAKDLQDKISR